MFPPLLDFDINSDLGQSQLVDVSKLPAFRRCMLPPPSGSSVLAAFLYIYLQVYRKTQKGGVEVDTSLVQ
jgi:hypothetical protein